MRSSLILIIALYLKTFVLYGQVKNQHKHVYRCEKIGWSIDVPENWKITSEDDEFVLDSSNRAMLEKTQDTKFDLSKTRKMISFQKDESNAFESAITPMIEKYPGQYDEGCREQNKLTYKSLTSLGTRFDSSSSTEIINGHKFNTFSITMYSPKGYVIIYQTSYFALINGFDVQMNICYNNDDDKAILLKALRNSKFK